MPLTAADKKELDIGSFTLGERAGEAQTIIHALADVVFIVTVLCFATDPQAVVNEAFRVLRSGGRLVLGEFERYSLSALIRRVRGLLGSTTWRDAHFFAPRDLRTLLQQAGFTDTITAAAVFYPPVQHVLARGAMERLGRCWCPWAGAFLVVRGRRGVRGTCSRRTSETSINSA